MEISKVSYSQPHFNGYLGRNIRTYVNHIVEKEVGVIVNKANFRMENVDVDKISAVKSLGDKVLGKFNQYVKGMNENTVLDINDVESSYMRFLFKNPLVPDKEVRVYGSSIFKKTILHVNDSIAIPEGKEFTAISNATKNDLFTLDRVADCLSVFPSKEIDNIFYKNASAKLKKVGESATGIWSKFKVRKLAKAIDKFAQGLGIDTSAQVRAEEYLRIAKERKTEIKMLEKQMKELSKNNQKIAHNVLNS